MLNKQPYEQIEEEVYDHLSDNIFEETQMESPLRIHQHNTDDLVDTIHAGDMP